jgi:ribosomal protein L37AE/L43A
MARVDFSNVPRGNPCAQCGKSIAFPDWVEPELNRTSYLWHCRACDYTFEAVAYFEAREADRRPLAA